MGMAQPRIAAATQRTQEIIKLGKSHKDRISNALAIKLVETRTTERFKAYDKDGDGFLCRAEIIEYSKQEFRFDIPDKNLERIFHQLVPVGGKGVTCEKFQQLKTAVGIARYEGRKTSPVKEQSAAAAA